MAKNVFGAKFFDMKGNRLTLVHGPKGNLRPIDSGRASTPTKTAIKTIKSWFGVKG